MVRGEDMSKSKKHDRQGVRTPADIERKYDLDGNAQLSAAAEAKQLANRALQAVDSLNRSLDKEELTDRLTNYTDIISSADGTVQIDLANNKVIISTYIGEEEGKFELSSLGLIGYALTTGTDSETGEETEEYVQSLVIEPSGKVNGKAVSWKDNEDGTFTLVGS